jgi:glycosyltransferase involved in cell wall biosynthesis
MRVAYLASQYPAVSHTFILREIEAVRALGVEVETFSVRRGPEDRALGEDGLAEYARTRVLVPVRVFSYLAAILWALCTRFRLFWKCLIQSVPWREARGLKAKLLWGAYFLEAVQLARWLRQSSAERLHVHFPNSGSSTGMIAALLAEIPFSMTAHGSELLEPERFQLGRKVEQCDFIACISEFGRKLIEAQVGPEHYEKLHIVRCGPAQFDPQPMVETDCPEVVCVARLSEEKGYFVLLEALRRLRDEGVNFHCTLVGGGPLESEIQAALLVDNLQDHVELAGARPPSEVNAFYARASVVVLASFHEGIPVVLMEAMATQRPVVATQVGGIPELIQDGKNGWLVPSKDADALATALREAVSDPSRARERALAGFRTVDTEYRIEGSAKRMVRLFHGETP